MSVQLSLFSSRLKLSSHKLCRFRSFHSHHSTKHYPHWDHLSVLSVVDSIEHPPPTDRLGQLEMCAIRKTAELHRTEAAAAASESAVKNKNIRQKLNKLNLYFSIIKQTNKQTSKQAAKQYNSIVLQLKLYLRVGE